MPNKNNQTGCYVPKLTKKEILGFIDKFYIRNGVYPTADDIAEKLKRPRKVIADYVSLYARYGILQAFKRPGQRVRYGPGANWHKTDGLGWVDFFRAADKCKHCGHGGVIGFKTERIIRYVCKWCSGSWDESLEHVSPDVLRTIAEQAEKTRKRWLKLKEGES